VDYAPHKMAARSAAGFEFRRAWAELDPMLRRALVAGGADTAAGLPSAGTKRGQQRQQALLLWRAAQRLAHVPVVIAYRAAIRLGGKGQQQQQALHCLCALQRHAAVPAVVTYSAAVSVCGKGQRHQQALHLLRAM